MNGFTWIQIRTWLLFWVLTFVRWLMYLLWTSFWLLFNFKLWSHFRHTFNWLLRILSVFNLLLLIIFIISCYLAFAFILTILLIEWFGTIFLISFWLYRWLRANIWIFCYHSIKWVNLGFFLFIITLHRLSFIEAFSIIITTSFTYWLSWYGLLSILIIIIWGITWNILWNFRSIFLIFTFLLIISTFNLLIWFLIVLLLLNSLEFI